MNGKDKEKTKFTLLCTKKARKYTPQIQKIKIIDDQEIPCLTFPFLNPKLLKVSFLEKIRTKGKINKAK